MQERLESSVAGRIAISAFVAFTVFSLVVWNLPDSEIKRRAFTVVRPYVTALSLDQNWGVFAPEPRRISMEMVAEVRFADGSEETFQVPRGNDVYGGYWDYRWWKWSEWARTDAHSDLWQPAAQWFARQAAEGGRAPVEVTLVRRWYDLLPPGPGPSRSELHAFAFYTLDLPPAEGAGG